jgi:hypothetical protein
VHVNTRKLAPKSIRHVERRLRTARSRLRKFRVLESHGRHILMGKSTPERVQDMVDNISNGRIAPVELIARKP